MSDLSDYKRCVSEPLERELRATIAILRAKLRALLDDVPSTWETNGYVSPEAEIADMANVGRSLIEAITDNTKSGPLKGWQPMDGPSEIVVDLLNLLADATADRDHYKALAERKDKALGEAELALMEARSAFRQYELLHRTKGTPEGHTKADANADRAAACFNAISIIRAAASARTKEPLPNG